MPHAAAGAVPILVVASTLGLEIEGRRARCFNRQGHKQGDRHPSLTFFPDSGRWKCFSCGRHGDAINLVQEVKGVPFTEAVAWILALAGGAAPKDVAGNIPRDDRQDPDAGVMDIYVNLKRLSLQISPKWAAGKYLRKRGITSELANDYDVAQNEPSQIIWDELCKKHDMDDLRAAGLVSRNGNYLFARHHLLFFYPDIDDEELVYVQARDITGSAQAKELSPSGLRCPLPFNAPLLKDAPDEVWVCEGCLDTLSALQLGYPAIGIPGVKRFRDDWLDFFSGIRRVKLVFDNDDAGRQAAIELRCKFRRRGIKADTLVPTCGEDINDLLVGQKGEEV